MKCLLWKVLDALREDDFLEGMTMVESKLTKLSHAGGYVHFYERYAIIEAVTADCSK